MTFTNLRRIFLRKCYHSINVINIENMNINTIIKTQLHLNHLFTLSSLKLSISSLFLLDFYLEISQMFLMVFEYSKASYTFRRQAFPYNILQGSSASY